MNTLLQPVADRCLTSYICRLGSLNYRSEIVVWQQQVRESAQKALKHAEYLRKWLVHSIQNESEAERRKKSHCGAVKSRRKADQCHWTDIKGRYFDVGNRNYALALTMLLPDLVTEWGWNDNSKGNLVEMLLAQHWEENGSVGAAAIEAIIFVEGIWRKY